MMTMLMALKYCCVALIVTWILRQPLVYAGMGMIALGVGSLMAAIAFERECPPHQTPPTPRMRVRPLRALIIGAGEVGRALARQLEANAGYHIVGFVDDQIEAVDQDRQAILGGRHETANLIEDYAIDAVFVAYAPTWQQKLAEELVTNRPDVQVRIVHSVYEAMLHTGRVESLGDIALVRLNRRAEQRTEIVKRFSDVTISLCAGALLSPFLLVIAALIKATSPGPVIFTQERVGRFGKPFILYKFRTMVCDAEAATGPVLASGKEDSRLTGIGRWLRLTRIDEIPQIWNILRGEMSLVGPRPERPCFVKEFECEIPAYAQRHQVRPGITGLAQVCGGYHTDARDKLRFDLIYASHQSPWLDISILLRTFLVVFHPQDR
jgi:exopolysaccharide biosynthesis polyprenyl glycosylphosphotransferase